MLLLGLGAFALAAGIHGLFHLLADGDSRPIPAIAAVPWVVASLGVAGMLASSAAIARRAQGVMATLGFVFLHVVLCMASLTGVLMSDPAFPFGPNYVESMDLPGSRGTAYLYRGGLFCSQTVRRAAPWSLWSQPDEGADSASCKVDGHLRWDPVHTQVDIVGPDGKPVPSDSGAWGHALDWSPH